MSAPPDEVLAAMAQGAYAVGRRWNAAAGKPAKPWEELDEEQQRYMLECSAGALAAAAALGWQLVPKVADEAMIEDLAISLYEERAKNRGLPMVKWENAPDLVRRLERRDAAAAHRLELAAAPKVGE